MQLVQQTIATSLDELRELMQHCILHEYSGRINLTFHENGQIEVWQPSKQIMAERVAVRFPVGNTYDNSDMD